LSIFKTAVFGEDSLLFNSYEEFAENGIAGFAGKTLVFVNVEFRMFGTKIHQLNLITVSTMTIPDDGNIRLQDIILATASPDALLPQQKPLVTEWIKSWVPHEAWTKTNRHIKRPIS
jgi:hypothetical protein